MTKLVLLAVFALEPAGPFHLLAGLGAHRIVEDQKSPGPLRKLWQRLKNLLPTLTVQGGPVPGRMRQKAIQVAGSTACELAEFDTTVSHRARSVCFS